MFVHREGLLVPADSEAGREAAAIAQRRLELQTARDLVAVEREHELQQLVQSAEYDIAMANLAERIQAAERARKQRTEDAEADDRLADLYRAAKRQGTDARIQALIYSSAEKRAGRVNKVKSFAMYIGLPVLVGFAAWSTTGVQAGFAKLMHLGEHTAMWWAAWVVEPCLIAIVAAIIIARAVLRTSGGNTDWRATAAEWTALATSVLLNIYGGWAMPGWAGLEPALTHSIGPLGAAGSAFLIGLFVDYATKAKPWDDAQRLDESGLAADAPARSDLPPMPSLKHLDYARPGEQGAQSGDPVTHVDGVRQPRKTGAQSGRVKTPAQAATSSYAHGEDPATRAALAYRAGEFKSKREAANAHGVSDGTVRNRLKELDAERPSTHHQTNGHPVLTESAN